MSSMMMQVLMAVLAGGMGNDMLDYMQTKAYWQGKGVAVTAEVMQAELKPASKEAVAGLVADWRRWAWLFCRKSRKPPPRPRASRK